VTLVLKVTQGLRVTLELKGVVVLQERAESKVLKVTQELLAIREIQESKAVKVTLVSETREHKADREIQAQLVTQECRGLRVILG